MTLTAEHSRHLIEISRHLAEIGTDFGAVLYRVTREVAERLGDAALLELMDPDAPEAAAPRLVPTSLYHPDPEAYALAIDLARSALEQQGNGLTGRVARTGQALHLSGVDPAELRGLAAPEVHAYLERFPVRAVLSVPLRTREGPLGVLTVWRDVCPDPYGDGDRELLQAIADHAALAVVNARLFDRLQMTHHALERRTRALEQALDELETFAWSVSHDLRAPLHTIQGFASAVREDYAAGLDPVGAELLERIGMNAERMSGLIEGLLELTRVSRVELTTTEVDLSALARDAVDSLRRREPCRRVEVEIAPGLRARGDRHLLHGLVAHLVGNAWKFTAGRPVARIEIGGQVGDAGTELCVRDDGVGFDMAFVDRLFTPFRRLHSRADFPGNGIGLAIVQRIARKHGGHATGQGEPGRGAEFRVFLPRTGAGSIA